MWSIIIPTLLRNHDLLNLILKDIYILAEAVDIEVLLIVDATVADQAFILPNEFIDFVKVIYSDVKGPGLLRNVGLNLASGDYVSFFDDDDRVKYHKGDFEFKTEVVLFEFDHPSKIFANNNFLDEVNNLKLSTTEQVCRLAVKNDFIFSYCQPFAFKRELLIKNEVYFVDSLIMEDIDFTSLIFSENYSLSVCQKIQYRYISHPSTTKSLSGDGIYKNACLITDRIRKRLIKSLNPEYTMSAYVYVKNVRRFRYLESTTSLESLNSNFNNKFFDNQSQSEDKIYWKYIVDQINRSSSKTVLYCYNNTSRKLISLVNSNFLEVVDDYPINLKGDVSNINFKTTNEFLRDYINGDYECVLILHAHPGVSNKVKKLFNHNFESLVILND